MICFHKKVSYFWIITQLPLLFCILFFQRDLSAQNYHYWWLTRKGSLVSSIYDGKKLNINQPLVPAERRSMIAIDPSDNSCWVTNTLNGEIYKHTTSGQKIIIKGFAAPVDLVVDAKQESIWVADAALNLLLRVNSNGQIDQKITARSIKSLVLGTDGNCWIINWWGIQPVIDQETMPPILKSVVQVSYSIEAQIVWCINKKGTVYRIRDNTIRRTPFVLPDSKGISATNDGGAWILRSTMAIRLSAEMKPIGEVTGFKNAKKVVSQPTDNSIWVIDNGYDRAVRLPKGDETTEVRLITITGWNKVANKKSLNLVQSDKFDWSRLDRAKVVTETPPDMVLIPAGEFEMGSNDFEDTKPIHSVSLNSFYMDKYEVTNTDYRTFVEETGHREPLHWKNSEYNYPNQPIVGIHRSDAIAYAQWAGKRLPTEAEWEYAARGGIEGMSYPLGNSLTNTDANFGNNFKKPMPVGKHAPNGFGLYDMVGNVWEICSDWYRKYYYVFAPKENPTGPKDPTSVTIRGGSYSTKLSFCRVDSRLTVTETAINGLFYARGSDLNCRSIGFRCVSDLEENPSSEKSSPINHEIEKQNSSSDDSTNLKVVEIQPSETFNQTPDFPKGGVLLIELFDNLNQRRIKDTEQMLGRQYVWNFDKNTYTVLLGLSLEAYNTYSNKPRQKWTKMVVEGTSIGQQLNEKMSKISNAQGWSREKYANFIVSFAKSLPYTADAASTGYDEFKMYAFETLVAGGIAKTR